MLSCISDNGQKDKANECLADMITLGNFFNGRNQVVSAIRSDDGHTKEAINGDENNL